jgi:hypothetical protein
LQETLDEEERAASRLEAIVEMQMPLAEHSSPI